LSSDQYNVNFGSATVSYNGSQISILDSKVPIKKEWVKDYSVVGGGSSSYQYGITVGLPLSEAQKAFDYLEVEHPILCRDTGGRDQNLHTKGNG